ncbi:MAG: hypothetical protein V4493_08280, partial [Pseudomonadota bacterium]
WESYAPLKKTDFSPGLFSDPNGLQALGCLNPIVDVSILDALLEVLKTSKRYSGRIVQDVSY